MTTTPKRPTRQKPPKPPGEAKPPRPPRPTYASTHQTVGVMIPTALMDRLAVVEARYGYRAVSLSALITATLEQWLDELERRLAELDPTAPPISASAYLPASDAGNAVPEYQTRDRNIFSAPGVPDPQHCGRPMVAVNTDDGKPIWWCADCHAKRPRKEATA